MEENNFKNVAIFIDYENVCKTLIKQYNNVIRLGFFDKIREFYKNKEKRLVKIAVYCNFDNKDLYESHHQSLLQSYGVETIHTSNQGKNYADLQITIDVLNSMYTNNNIDEFIIMSNDKDMTPLLNTLRTNKRKASVLTTGEEYNKTLCEFADEQIRFEEVIKYDLEKELFIDNIEKKFYENLENVINNNLNIFKSNKKQFKHYNIEYFVESQSAYYQIMQYEIYNMIRIYLNEGKIFLYRNDWNGKLYTSIAPLKYKKDFISLSIIDDNNIYNDFNIDDFVNKKYEEYFSSK